MADSLEDTSRFLMQSTLGADYDFLEHVANKGITIWLDEQIAHDSSFNIKSNADAIWSYFRTLLQNAHGEANINGRGNNPALPYKYYFRMAWWDRVLRKGRSLNSVPSIAEDGRNLVRHRIAQALSEILVVSENSILEQDSVGLASYYDIFYENAFGSYSDILYKVSMHPCMGVYLTHMNNRKEVMSENIHPDENYAREIMQLFTIGLFELNPDGSRKQGANGDIPSYDNNDIKQLARVFTGIKASRYLYEWPSGLDLNINNQPINLGDNVSKTFKRIPYVDMVNPMTIDGAFNDTGAKSLLKGHINIGAGVGGTTAIREVVDKLVSHPNTAPFIAKKLIQQLVTSNPSKAYVSAVANAFGTNGDMAATVRAILLHPEAASPEKLKSPTLRVCQLLRAVKINNTSDKLWLVGDQIKEQLAHHPLAAPTVFNFYKPDFSPHGDIENQGKVAPEFELHNAATSIAYVNLMYDWLLGDAYPAVSTRVNSDPSILNVPELDYAKLAAFPLDKLKPDFSAELPLALDANKHDELIDRISLLLTGSKNITGRAKIKAAYSQFATDINGTITNQTATWIVQTVYFMVAISADFAVLGEK